VTLGDQNLRGHSIRSCGVVVRRGDPIQRAARERQDVEVSIGALEGELRDGRWPT
jgi:hypothetical protein